MHWASSLKYKQSTGSGETIYSYILEVQGKWDPWAPWTASHSQGTEVSWRGGKASQELSVSMWWVCWWAGQVCARRAEDCGEGERGHCALGKENPGWFQPLMPRMW